MWLSETGRRIEVRTDSTAEIGTVSIGGAEAAVQLDGERRTLELLRPANILRIPVIGEEQLVLLCGDGSRVAAGTLGAAIPAGMEPGDICIMTENAAITVKNSGAVNISGQVSITGSLRVNGRSIDGD